MSLLSEIVMPEHATEKPLLWLIFGPPKVGKTTLAASFPSPLLVDIEGGTGFIRVPQFPLREKVANSGGTTAHAILGQLYKELRAGDHGFKSVIFDTADELWDMLAKPRKKAGKLPLSEYQELYDQFLGILESFRALGLDIVLTAHVKSETDEDGRIIATDVKLPGSLQGRVTGKVDEILYLTMKRSEDAQGTERGVQNRVLVCQPTDHPKYGQIRAGDRSGRLPAIITNPKFADLSVAKTFAPGLFDGRGDVQDVPPNRGEESQIPATERVPTDAELDAERAQYEAEMDGLFGTEKKQRTRRAEVAA